MLWKSCLSIFGNFSKKYLITGHNISESRGCPKLLLIPYNKTNLYRLFCTKKNEKTISKSLQIPPLNGILDCYNETGIIFYKLQY